MFQVAENVEALNPDDSQMIKTESECVVCIKRNSSVFPLEILIISTKYEFNRDLGRGQAKGPGGHETVSLTLNKMYANIAIYPTARLADFPAF
jgi:hypothetical protein